MTSGSYDAYPMFIVMFAVCLDVNVPRLRRIAAR